MATIIVGCDKNGVNDKLCRDTVAKLLEKAGHKVEKLPIGPGQFATASYSKKNKGKIGVFLIAAGTFSIADFYYGKTHFKYAYFGIRGDISSQKAGREPGFSTLKIGKDPDCTSVCSKIAGLTFKQMNEKLKDRVHIVGGSTPTEIGNNIVQAMGGETQTSETNKEDSVSTIKTALKQVLYGWNGEVECYIRDNTVHVHKIRDPSYTKLSLIEGINIYDDSITLTDINPNTPNKLEVIWGDDSFILKDDAAIKRFGTIKKVVKTTVKKEKDAINFAYKEWAKLQKNNGRRFECKVDGDTKWKNGEWARVYSPSFNIDSYMFITKVSQSDSGEWECNLTLVDYPPDLGEEPPTTNNEGDNS